MNSSDFTTSQEARGDALTATDARDSAIMLSLVAWFSRRDRPARIDARGHRPRDYGSMPCFFSIARSALGELVKIIYIHNKYSVILSAYIFLVCLRDIVILQ